MILYFLAVLEMLFFGVLPPPPSPHKLNLKRQVLCMLYSLYLKSYHLYISSDSVIISLVVFFLYGNIGANEGLFIASLYGRCLVSPHIRHYGS